MKKGSLILLSILLSSCVNSRFKSAHHFEVDDELLPYVEKFEQLGNLKVVNLIAHFGELSQEEINIILSKPGNENVEVIYNENNANRIGVCYYGGGTPKIIVNSDWWADASTWEKEQLMFHELGHCVLELGHNTEKLENEYPASLMYPYHFSDEQYVENYDYYINELFGRL